MGKIQNRTPGRSDENEKRHDGIGRNHDIGTGLRAEDWP